MTRDEIYTMAQGDAKTSKDFETKARRWYNECMSRIALVTRLLGQWNITVVDGTEEYNYLDVAVAVPQSPLGAAVIPRVNGLKYAWLLKTGETDEEELALTGENDRETAGVRIFKKKLFIQPEPDYGGTLKLYGFYSMNRWEAAAGDSAEPEIDEEFHEGIAAFLTAKYWLVERQNRAMHREWMDAFDLMLANLTEQTQSPVHTEEGFAHDLNW